MRNPQDYQKQNHAYVYFDINMIWYEQQRKFSNRLNYFLCL